MGKSQRTKGAVGEREVCDIFTAALNLPEERKIKRHIGQARDGGNDIDVGPLVVEVKRRKALGTVYKWLQQAIDAATVRPRANSATQFAPFLRGIPAVVAREDGGQWIVITRLSDFLKLTIDELRAHYAGDDE